MLKRPLKFGCGEIGPIDSGKEPTIKVLVRNPSGLTALSRLDELGICEAYMAGSLDVTGDMLGFVGLRGLLSDRHPLYALWQRLAPILIGRDQTDTRAISIHYDFNSEFYLKFMDASRCYSQAAFESDNKSLETAQRRKLNLLLTPAGCGRVITYWMSAAAGAVSRNMRDDAEYMSPH